MYYNQYSAPCAEPLEVVPETSVATSDPDFDMGPTFEGMNPDEQEW